ncbi:unannotated protein [freshwater metagenome]|jgi:uncharacterized membrane protein|uniref:Unannotated protein n=1 Tax=freshwater metagenome TaxID=449393 RepID=A0A6J6SE34_9ZZZZ|nr:DUF975 family protein [Acidimicrobiia bacterium]MSV40423.1 DUF975 family protein [Actinomycetota bacterium]MSV95441.1 DUF975 family protein [Actinomycetota bacterium]MSW60662.1 DUF975 family protein [Actinomycetota bacterium]MSY45424.1 DUF975 family protein [Actinomycetota bacterium]
MTQSSPAVPSGSYRVGDSISYGWNAFLKNIGPMILITLVILAVQVLLNVVVGADAGVARIILQLVAFIVGLILGMGLIRASLAITDGVKPEVSMLAHTAGLGSYLVAAIIFGIAVFVGLILFIIPGIIVSLIFMFYGYAIVQNPSTSPIDALKRSAEITKGHRWQLLGLVVLLIIINVIGAILCGIGLLFTYGITAIAVAHAYKSLSGQPIAAIA